MIRSQKVHAQQAVRYLRGIGDGMCSHTSVPMLSNAITAYVTNYASKMFTSHTDDGEHVHSNDDQHTRDDDNNHEDQTDYEPFEVRIMKDIDGKLIRCNQVDDYIHRDEQLADVNFYDFIRCYQKERRQGGHFKEDGGYYARYKLLQPHPQHNTHMLIEVADTTMHRPTREKPPRVIGQSIPHRSNNEKHYFIFMLAHFLPFSATNPINVPHGDLQAPFES